MTLEAQAQKLIAGLVRVAVMAPAGAAPEDHNVPPAHRQVLLLLSRRDREYRLSELVAELGSTVPTTLGVISPLIGQGLVELTPAPPHASRDMRVAATERGLALTPAPRNWTDLLVAHLERLDGAAQQRLLRLVTTQISELQRDGRIPITRMCLSCRFFDGYRHPGSTAPHHCWFVDAPFGYQELRLHCPDHMPGGTPPPRG